MSLVLKSKTEVIELNATFGGFNLTYRYNVKDGAISESVSGTAQTAEGRQVLNYNTHDGVQFYGNINDTASDDLTGLAQKMKGDIGLIFAGPETFGE